MVSLHNPKLIKLEAAASMRKLLREKGQQLTITNGCFDLLHAGHVYFLREAAKQGDVLWLLLNSDSSVSALKGSLRPVQGEVYRAYVIAALEYVDAVIIFDTPRLDQELRILKPDIYVKAGDYNIDSINADEKTALLDAKVDIRFLPFLKGFSSTSLMKKIAQAGS